MKKALVLMSALFALAAVAPSAEAKTHARTPVSVHAPAHRTSVKQKSSRGGKKRAFGKKAKRSRKGRAGRTTRKSREQVPQTDQPQAKMSRKLPKNA